MQLSKKQVKAFLDVLGKDDSRPTIMRASVQEYEGHMYLVATDSYKLAALYIGDVVTEELSMYIEREDLVKWYKLASNKDSFDYSELKERLQPQGDQDRFPAWQKLVPKEEPTPLPSVYFNARFMLTMEELADSSLKWEFNGRLGPMLAKQGNSIYIVMPLKS